MHSSGKTIILVTHDMSAVQRFCNKALLIENGKIKLIGDPFEVADTYKEANIEGEKNTKNNTSHKSSHELIAKISSKNKENITVDFNYTSTTDDEMYIGISVILNGISIAEITTSLDKPLIGSGKLIYTLSKDRLNGGMYNVTAALFKKETREPLAINNVKNTFKVDGYDISRGGALKLEDTWVYEK
jgi:ABC-2 type transport system ATP-binding protein